MRAVRQALAVLAVVPLLTACSGKDAALAQQLLTQAQQAQSSVTSETFSAHVTITAKDQNVGLVMSGGGYAKGPNAGDVVMDMSLSSSVPLPVSSMEFAKVGDSAWVEIDGKRTAVPVTAFGGQTGSTNPLGSFDLTRYVKDVSVETGQVLDGKSVTKITGILDTAALVQGLGSLGGASSAAGLPDLSGKVGDTRAVIYIDDTTHLLVTALADLTLHGDGGDVTMHLDVAITGVNQPVALPSA